MFYAVIKVSEIINEQVSTYYVNSVHIYYEINTFNIKLRLNYS